MPFHRSFGILLVLVLAPCLGVLSAYGDGYPIGERIDSVIRPVFQDAMEDNLVPGTVLVVVHDGEVVLTRAYGYADIARSARVTDETVFRVASVSKVLTALAVMQLVDQGLVRFDDPVQDYLDFAVENPFDVPVTVRHLLTHTAGFDRRTIGQRSHSLEGMLPLGEYLRARLSPVVRRPGEIFAYSNHGFALAGYLVERVRGKPFGRCAEEHLFRPLGMDHTSFEVDPRLEQRLAAGYQWSGDAWQPVAFDYPMTVPSSSLVTTGRDMARLLVMLLGDGTAGQVRIVEETSLNAMQSIQFTNHGALGSGYGFGFFVQDRGDGTRQVWHSGDFRGWSAHMALWPEHGLGMFMASNTPRGARLHRMVAGALDELFPHREPSEEIARRTEPLPADFTQTPPAQLVGTYGYVGNELLTINKMNMFPGVGPRVLAADGTIVFDGEHYREIAPLVFQQVDGSEKLAFLRDGAGRVAYVASGTRAYFRMKWFQTMPLHAAILLVGAACALSTLIWPIAWVSKRFRYSQGSWMRAYAAGVWLLYVAFFAGIFFYGRNTATDYGVPPPMAALFLCSTGGAIGALALPWTTVRAWRRRCWGLAGSIHYTVVSAGALAFAWMLFYWNLVGFRF